MNGEHLPMGGCSSAEAHEAHLAAGNPRCENDRELEEEPRRQFTEAEAEAIVRIVRTGKELTHEVARRYKCRPVDVFRLVTEAAERDAAQGKYPE